MTRTLTTLAVLAALGFAQEAPNLAKETPPAAKVTVADALRTGVAWLVANQNADGSWGKFTSGRSYEVTADVPGGLYAFRSASTSLCWMGLRAAPEKTDAARKAEARALKWLVKNARVKRPKGWELYNVWALSYGLEALAQALHEKAPGATEAEIRAAAAQLLVLLDKYQTPDGGYGYYDFRVKAARPSWGTSFTTATALVAIHKAEEAGLEPSRRVIDKAIRFLWRQRTANGDFVYSADHKYAPRGRINRPQGASMRNPGCHLAMRLHGEKIAEAVLRKNLEDLLVKHHRFAIAALRRPVPHESHYAVSGYFYLYGHYYAAKVLDYVPEADVERFAPRLAAAVLKARQPDGSFWDYPLYGFHKAYGTGYALVALAQAHRHGVP